MNVLTLHLRPDVTVVAVLVAPYAEFIHIEDGDLWFIIDNNPDYIELPPGQYEIVGLLRDFKDAEELAVLNVAIRKEGGDPELNWLIIKKIQ